MTDEIVCQKLKQGVQKTPRHPDTPLANTMGQYRGLEFLQDDYTKNASVMEV